MEPFSISSGSPSGEKSLDEDQTASSAILRRRKWTLGGVLLLALLGTTGLVVSLSTKRGSNRNNSAIQSSGDDAPLRGTDPTVPDNGEMVTGTGTTPATTASNSNNPVSTTSASTPYYYDPEDEPQVRAPHRTCSTAAPLPLEGGLELLEGIEPNPTPDEAVAAACQAMDPTTRAVYYKFTAHYAGPIAMSLTRSEGADPVVISVLQGSTCDDTMACVGSDYNAMTWDAYAPGETFIVMIHQVVGVLDWYVWTPETD